jgi:flagellar biosynthetic protein FlhB
MAEESYEEKSEKPTPKKREEAREKGQVAKSREITSVAVLLTGLFTLGIFGAFIYSGVREIMRETLSNPLLKEPEIGDFAVFFRNTIFSFIVIIAPLLAAVFLAAVLSNIMQIGVLFSGELIKPKLSKLNPVKGMARLFSLDSFMELVKSLLKLAVTGGTAYFCITREMAGLSLLGDLELGSIFSYMLSTFYGIFLKCSLAMAVLAVLDYAFQRWEFEKKIRMTKQEIKEEFKKSEGDPLIKSRIRSIQMEMARRRMMQAVPKADVIITNPTHLAVALRYDAGKMNAPQVTAKGAGLIAAKIRETAAKHRIPVVENKELARGLYKTVRIGQEIPAALYRAAAEVLAYVYKLKGRRPVRSERLTE